MNCSQHPDVVAVAACEKCGVGMCADCLNASEYTWESKPVCRQCNRKLNSAILEENHKKKTWTIVKIALGGLCVLIAIIALASGAEVEQVIFISALGALPTGFSAMFRSTAESRMRSTIDYHANDIKYGQGSGFMGWVLGGFFKLILAFLISAVASPILLIVNIFKLVKINREIEEDTAVSANFAV